MRTEGYFNYVQNGFEIVLLEHIHRVHISCLDVFKLAIYVDKEGNKRELGYVFYIFVHCAVGSTSIFLL